MKPDFECGVTASFLSSGQLLCNASNCAAIIAAAGMFLTHARLWFAGSILCWPVACYLGIRVAIDASLFRELAVAPLDRGSELDEALRVPPGRTISERSRGALRLWKGLIAAVVVQLSILAAALALS
jgi:hypothetical protein